MSTEAVATRLKQIRQCEGYTQRAFAEMLNISLRSYRNYEYGERDLPASVLVDLYELLLVDPVWLMTGTPMSVPPVAYSLPARHAILKPIRS